MSTWQSNYKAMTAEELSAEYQRLLMLYRHPADWVDRLNFLKSEFLNKVKR